MLLPAAGREIPLDMHKSRPGPRLVV